MKTNSVHPTECTDLNLLRKAHTAAKAVPLSQDTCWPVPYCDDSRCRVTDHTEAVNAVQASEGLVWEFDRWASFARTLLGRIRQLTGSTEPDRVIIHSQAGVVGPEYAVLAFDRDLNMWMVYTRHEDRGNLMTGVRTFGSRHEADEAYSERKAECLRISIR